MNDVRPSNAQLTDREMMQVCLASMREAHKQPGSRTDWSLMIEGLRLHLELAQVETLQVASNLVSRLREFDWYGPPRKGADELLTEAADQIEAMASVGIRQEREIERLRAALERYGRHEHPNCYDLTLKEDGSFGPRNGCLCGFDAAKGEESPVEAQPALANGEPGPWWTPTAEVDRLMRWCKDANTITLEISTKVLEGLIYDSLLWRKDRAAQPIKPDETSRDDARDAARYRYLRERLACDRLAARKLVITTEGGREPYRTLREAELDREIDECIGLSVEPSYKSQLPPTSLRLPMPPVKPPREPDLTCDGFVPDPHSSFCDKCGYPEREHRRTVKAGDKHD